MFKISLYAILKWYEKIYYIFRLSDHNLISDSSSPKLYTYMYTVQIFEELKNLNEGKCRISEIITL
jgi:hypothetical protein